MIDCEGHVKIIDFGFAKCLKRATDLTYTHCGTPGYIAPEIMNKNGHGLQADIWALGILFSEMIGG
jgi:protein kinase A